MYKLTNPLRLRVIPENILFSTAFSFLILILGLCLLTFPTVDDIWFASIAREYGIIDGVIWFYNHWSGRWASNFMILTTTAIPNFEWIYGTILAFHYVLFLTTWRYLWLVIWPELSTPLWGVLTCTLVASLSLTEVIFWQSGSFAYLGGLTISCLIIIGRYKGTPLTIICAMLCGLILGGYNETQALSVFSAFAFFLLIDSIYYKRIILNKILPNLLICGSIFIGIYITHIAPGNDIRAHAIQESLGSKMQAQNLIHLIWLPFIHIETIISTISIFLLTLVIIKTTPSAPIWTTNLNLFCWISLIIIITLSSIFPRALILSGPGPHRAYTAELSILIPALFIFSLFFFKKYFSHIQRTLSLQYVALIIMIPIVLGLRGADWIPLRDQIIAIGTDAWSVYQQQYTRNTLLNQNLNIQEVPSITFKWNRPATFYMDIPTEKNNDLAKQFASYYRRSELSSKNINVESSKNISK